MNVLTSAGDMPWAISSPFRMRPGLSRLAPPGPSPAPALFVRDALAGAYAAEKRRLRREHPTRTPIGAADPQVLAAIAQAYAAQTGVSLAPEAGTLALGMQEDFVVLHDESDNGVDSVRTRFLSVSFPSNWTPAEKLGLDFAAIHAPVADNALLQAGGKGIIDMAFRQAPMLRHVWLLTPNGDLAQHPETRQTRWEDALGAADAPGASGRLLDQVFFRVERQTTLPLPALRRGVFFIRVMVAPLPQVLAVAPERAAELSETLASMSEAVVAYRGMTAVRGRLCAELRPT
jgi:dimethylamine monooxygenase subunit A